MSHQADTPKIPPALSCCAHGKTIAELCYACFDDAQSRARRKRRRRIERLVAKEVARELLASLLPPDGP